MRAWTLMLVALLTGCAGAPRVETVEVRVPVPVECRETVPERPAMPTEVLRPGASLDDFARAAMAELERREGYEGQLVAALRACTAPVEEVPQNASFWQN